MSSQCNGSYHIQFNTSFVSNSGIQFVPWLKYFVCQKHYKKFPNISTRSLEEGRIWSWDFGFDLDRKNTQGSQGNTATYTTERQIAKGLLSKSWFKFMPIYISDNQEIILYESANIEHLNKQSLWQPIRRKKTKYLTKQGDCASWKYTTPHVFSKNTFRQETNKPKCFVSRNRPCFYITTYNVAKPFHSTNHQFGIEIRRPETSVTWLGVTSGRPRKLKILYLQSPCKLIHLIYEGWNFNSGNYLFTTDTK